MKAIYKSLILAGVALAALSACTKVQSAGDQLDHVISFQLARYNMPTKAEGDPADYKIDYSNVPFGAYAWYKAVQPADNATFMTNQKVSYKKADNVWLPEGSTYYWPKSGTLDFICYSPYSADTKVIAITEDKISFNGYTVGTDDLMYADKVTGLSDNKKTYFYNGVPVLFHHALARVTFQVSAAYLEKTAETGDKTKWEIVVNDVTVKDVLVTGDLVLSGDGASWKLPENKVWTPSGAKKDMPLDTKDLKPLTVEPQDLGASMYVLPQLLSQGQQAELTITIKTYRDSGDGYELVLTENNVKVTGALAGGNLPAWGINQDIAYNFVIAPSQSKGNGGDPTKPVDPKDPDLSDAEIIFDPAVIDWQKVDVNSYINL